jgi:hypothetical protein
VESFNGKFCDELFSRELFPILEEVRWLIDRRRLDDNHDRPHSALEYQTPAAGCVQQDFATLNPVQHSQTSITRFFHSGWY